MAKDKKAAATRPGDVTTSTQPAADAGEGWTSPPLRIAAAREGRRRAGIEHSRQARLHPAGAFTLEQVEQLELDPVLSVERLSDEQYAAALKQAAARTEA